jgi:hypothetical protein
MSKLFCGGGRLEILIDTKHFVKDQPRNNSSNNNFSGTTNLLETKQCMYKYELFSSMQGATSLRETFACCVE